MDCKIWGASKINYAFVFEFDTRHVLDWRELLEVTYQYIKYFYPFTG